MDNSRAIPVFTLFGETEHFPDVIHCERFSARAPEHGWRISAHRHAQMAQVFLILKGRVDARVDGADEVLTDGMFLFIPRQVVHQFAFEPATDGWVFSLPSNVVSSVGPDSRDIADALSKPFVGTVSPRLAKLSDLLADTSARASLFRAQQAVGLSHSLLSLIAEQAKLATPSLHQPANARLAALDHLIAQHLADGWTATTYASSLSVSTGHLSRLCRQASGMGASAYIEHSIMAEACRMLAFTQMSISEIGYRLGYEDPPYFSKRFRVVRRQTPSQYRAQFVG